MGATVSVISEELARPVDAADVPSCVDPLKVSRLRRLLHVAFRDEGGYELDDAALTPQLAHEVDELLTDCAAEPGLTRLANDKILRRLLRQQARALPVEALEESLDNSVLSASDGLSRSGNSDLGGTLSDSMRETSIGEISPKAPTFVQEPRLSSRRSPSLSVGSEGRTSPPLSVAEEVTPSPDQSLKSSSSGRSRSDGAQPRERKSDIASMAKQHARSRHLRRREQKRKEQLAAAQQQNNNSSDPNLLRAQSKSSSINEDLQQAVDDDSDNLSLGSGTSSAYSYASTANSNTGSAAGAAGRRSSLSLGSYPAKQVKRRSVTFSGAGGGEPTSGAALSVATNIGSLDGSAGGALATISSPSAKPPRRPRPSFLEIEGGNSSGSGSGSGDAVDDFGESGWRGDLSPLTAQSMSGLLPAEQEKISLRRSSIASTTAAIAALERHDSVSDDSVASSFRESSSVAGNGPAPTQGLTKAQLWRKSSMDNRMLRQMNSGYSGSNLIQDDEVPRAPPDTLLSSDYREAPSAGGGSTTTEATETMVGRPRPKDLALPSHDERDERAPSFDQTPPQDKTMDPFGVSSSCSGDKPVSAASALFPAAPAAAPAVPASPPAPSISAAAPTPPLSSAPSRPMAGRPRPMALKLAAEDDNNAAPLIMAPQPRVPQASLLSLLDGDNKAKNSTSQEQNGSGNSSGSSGGSSSNSSDSEQPSLLLNTTLEKPRVGGGVTHRGSLRGLSNTTELNASLRDPSYDLTGELSLSGGELGSTAYLSQSGTLEVQNFRISESGIVSTPTGSFGMLNRSGSGNLDSGRSNGSGRSNSSSVKSTSNTGSSSSANKNKKSSKSSRGSLTYAARPQLNRTSSAGGPRPFVELQRLGAGASGTVVKALHVASLALVAIKTLPIFDADKRHQMARELKLLYKWQRAIVGDAHGYDHDAAGAATAASKSANKTLTVADCCPFAAAAAAASSADNSSAAADSLSAAELSVVSDHLAAGSASCPFAQGARKAEARAPAVGGAARLDADEKATEFKAEATGTAKAPVEAATAAVAAELSPSHRSRSSKVNSSSSSSSSKCDGSKRANPTRCPHIVSFYDAFVNSEASSVSLVVEYMNGGSLQDLVEQGGCDDEAFLASVASGTLRALLFLHEQCKPPMLHRDIKPANILINTRGLCKIADFGIYHEMDPTGDGHARTFIGSLSFMSPERITGGEYSTPADIWAIGLTLMTVALGRCPVTDSGRGYWALLHELTDKPPPTLPPGDDRFSPTFRDFLSCMLCALPHERWPASRLLLHPFFAMHGFAEAHKQDISTPVAGAVTATASATNIATGAAVTAAEEAKVVTTGGTTAVAEAKADMEKDAEVAGGLEAANEAKIEATITRIDSLDMGNGEATSASNEAKTEGKPEALSQSADEEVEVDEPEPEVEEEEEEADLEGGSLQGAELAQVVDALESVVRDYAIANAAAAASDASATASNAAASNVTAASTRNAGDATTSRTGPKLLPLPPWLPVLTENKLRGLAWQIDMPYNRVRAAIEARFNGQELPVLLEPLPVLPW